MLCRKLVCAISMFCLCSKTGGCCTCACLSLPTQTDKRPYHSYEDTFNPDTASTLNFRLKDTDKDATVIANVHGSGDEGEEMVVSGAHVDVRKEKALVLENIYMSENELDQAEPAPAGMEGMVRMGTVYADGHVPT